MIIDRAGFVEYFRKLAEDHKDVNSFIYGSSERLLRAITSDLDYPVVMLAMPDVAILPDDGGEKYVSTLLFLTGASNDEDEEDAAIEAMYRVGRSFHMRLKNDSQYGDFGYGRSETSLQVKARRTADNCWGYVLDFDMILRGEGCYDPSDFVP